MPSRKLIARSGPAVKTQSRRGTGDGERTVDQMSRESRSIFGSDSR